MYARAAQAGAATFISNLDPDRTVWYFYGADNDSYAHAVSPPGNARGTTRTTVISNLGPAGRPRCLVFFTTQLMRATVILNSNSHVWRIISRRIREDNDLTVCALRGANVLLNYAIPGTPLLSGSAS